MLICCCWLREAHFKWKNGSSPIVECIATLARLVSNTEKIWMRVWLNLIAGPSPLYSIIILLCAARRAGSQVSSTIQSHSLTHSLTPIHFTSIQSRIHQHEPSYMLHSIQYTKIYIFKQFKATISSRATPNTQHTQWILFLFFFLFIVVFSLIWKMNKKNRNNERCIRTHPIDLIARSWARSLVHSPVRWFANLHTNTHARTHTRIPHIHIS